MKLKLYVVRKSYADVDSQLCAYVNNLDNAIKDCPPGYNVYNVLTGKVCYSNLHKVQEENKYEKMWNKLYRKLAKEQIQLEKGSYFGIAYAQVITIMNEIKKEVTNE